MGLQDPAYPSHSKYQPPLSCSALRGGNSHVDAGGSHARLQRHSGTQPPPAGSFLMHGQCSSMQHLASCTDGRAHAFRGRPNHGGVLGRQRPAHSKRVKI